MHSHIPDMPALLWRPNEGMEGARPAAPGPVRGSAARHGAAELTAEEFHLPDMRWHCSAFMRISTPGFPSLSTSGGYVFGPVSLFVGLLAG